MIYQKEWLLRQIEQMVDAITHILAQKASAATTAQTAELEFREAIESQLRAGEICKVEDWLYKNRVPDDEKWLHLSLLFYSEINNFSDAKLEQCNFSREEILSGLQDVCRFYGYPVL